MRAAAGMGLGLLVAIGAAEPMGGGRDARSVLLIMVDDLRPEIGAYGSTRAITPNIDRLASQGLLFERAYTSQALCAPSRAALLSGLRPDSTGIDDLNTPLRSVLPNHVTLPQHFRRHGYTTVALGKVYHHRDEDPRGWSEPPFLPTGGWTEQGHGWRGRGYLDPASWRELQATGGRGPAYEAAAVPDTAYPDGKIASRAIEQLRRLKDQPFFLAVGFTKPHLPFNAPQKYWDLYPREGIRLPDNYFKPEHVTRYSLTNFGELRAYTDVPRSGPVPDDKARELIRGYLAATSYVDAQIGRVLEELDRLNLDENTIVVLWGDQGYKLGEHAAWAKHTNFEIDTRTPLIVRAPGMTARGHRTRALVEAVDVYPTLSELAGLPGPRHQGLSFAPLLTDPSHPWKTAVFSQYPRGPDAAVMGRSIRTERFRYTEWQDTRSGQVLARELYDHERDPHENVNVAADPRYAAEIARLSHRLTAGWRGALPETASHQGSGGSGRWDRGADSQLADSRFSSRIAEHAGAAVAPNRPFCWVFTLSGGDHACQTRRYPTPPSSAATCRMPPPAPAAAGSASIIHPTSGRTPGGETFARRPATRGTSTAGGVREPLPRHGR